MRNILHHFRFWPQLWIKKWMSYSFIRCLTVNAISNLCIFLYKIILKQKKNECKMTKLEKFGYISFFLNGNCIWNILRRLLFLWWFRYHCKFNLKGLSYLNQYLLVDDLWRKLLRETHSEIINNKNITFQS